MPSNDNSGAHCNHSDRWRRLLACIHVIIFKLLTLDVWLDLLSLLRPLPTCAHWQLFNTSRCINDWCTHILCGHSAAAAVQHQRRMMNLIDALSIRILRTWQEWKLLSDALGAPATTYNFFWHKRCNDCTTVTAAGPTWKYGCLASIEFFFLLTARQKEKLRCSAVCCQTYVLTVHRAPTLDQHDYSFVYFRTEHPCFTTKRPYWVLISLRANQGKHFLCFTAHGKDLLPRRNHSVAQETFINRITSSKCSFSTNGKLGTVH